LVNHEDFPHLGCELRVAFFQVVFDLVRLQMLLRQNLLHGGFGGASQVGVTGAPGLPAHMGGQRAACPQLRRIAEFFGFGAGRMRHPSFIGVAEDRFFGAMKGVLEASLDAHGQSFVQAIVNGHPADTERSLDGRGIHPGMVMPKNLRALDRSHRGRTRCAQSLQVLFLLSRENQSREFRFANHAFHS
jgi:hypothetical protein